MCAVLSLDLLLTEDNLECDVLPQEPVSTKHGTAEYVCASSFCVSRTGIVRCRLREIGQERIVCLSVGQSGQQGCLRENVCDAGEEQ